MYVFGQGANVVPRLKAGSKGARFENPEAIEAMGRDLTLSVRNQSVTEESGAGEEPIKSDRGHYSSATV